MTEASELDYFFYMWVYVYVCMGCASFVGCFPLLVDWRVVSNVSTSALVCAYVFMYVNVCVCVLARMDCSGQRTHFMAGSELLPCWGRVCFRLLYPSSSLLCVPGETPASTFHLSVTVTGTQMPACSYVEPDMCSGDLNPCRKALKACQELFPSINLLDSTQSSKTVL